MTKLTIQNTRNRKLYGQGANWSVHEGKPEDIGYCVPLAFFRNKEDAELFVDAKTFQKNHVGHFKNDNVKKLQKCMEELYGNAVTKRAFGIK